MVERFKSVTRCSNSDNRVVTMKHVHLIKILVKMSKYLICNIQTRYAHIPIKEQQKKNHQQQQPIIYKFLIKLRGYSNWLLDSLKDQQEISMSHYEHKYY